VNNPLDELRARARRALGIERLHQRIDHLEAQMRVLEPGGWERSQERWRNVAPNEGLTWGYELSGDAFIAKASEYDAFSQDKKVLEIGPGYGRLLKACLDRSAPFAEYLGVDISPQNVDHLRQHFADKRVSFAIGDVTSMVLEKRYDVVLSSLVFKHLYPTFETALRNCVPQLNPQALICFDLIEGSGAVFESDGVTYIKPYTRSEVSQILRRCGLDLVEFTSVRHDETHERLLTVARKSADPRPS
jgi:2-polyprenyl-3-methyl-5-hydroxy-6-metoxy-1,4-benzoquinol methylase